MCTFYEAAFGWKTEQLGPAMSDYVTVVTTATDADGMPATPGAINGGFYQKTDDGAMQHPSIVISVENLEEGMKRVLDAGGTLHGEPADIPGVGRWASFVDTEGNRVSMLEPLPRGATDTAGGSADDQAPQEMLGR